MKDIYKQYLKLNRNIFIAFAVDFVVSAMVAQMLIEQEHYLNTTITLLADHGTFLSILGFAALGIAEIIYTIVRWGFQYYFLTVDYEPYLASIIGQIIAVSIYMVIINFLVKITKWYKND